MSPEILRQYEEGMADLILQDLKDNVTLYAQRTLKSKREAWTDILKYILKYVSEEVDK